MSSLNSIRKILIISCSSGMGHVRAAEALLAAYQQDHPEVISHHIDMVDHSGIILKTIMVDSYNFVIKHWPQIFGKLFYYTDSPKRKGGIKMTTPLLKMSGEKCIEFIKEFNPDRVICTHFIAPLLLSTFPHHFPIDVVVTDYYAHQIWVAPGIRHLFVATEEIKQALGKKHSSVIVSGIPIHPRFLKQKNHPQLLLKFKIANQSPVVLFLSGGNGLVDTSKTVEYILKEYSNLTIIAISGKGNEALYQKLIGLPHGKNDYRVFKFLDNIDEWMRIANIIVTKPGGLTVTECLYLKKPMLLLNPIPGQEEKNAQYVTTQHFGKLVNNPKELVSSIKLLLENPSMFKTPPSLPNPNEVIFNQS